jgi:predicted transport protein
MKIHLWFVGKHVDTKSGEQRERTRQLLKPEYVGKSIEVDYDDRSSVVRTFMDIFLEREYTAYEIRAVTRFLKRYYLSRAEIHAIILHLGYRYNKRNKAVGNMALADYLDNNPNGTKGYVEEDNFRGLPNATFALYQELKGRILSLGADIKIKVWKRYISFVANTDFVIILPQMLQLKLWINLPKGALEDPKNIARDVSEIEHYGNGDYEVHVGSSSEFDYLMNLIKQSYNSHSLTMMC